MNRITWLDTAKGIGILLVILGHMAIPEKLSIIIFSFHMPLFFFISGFLFNENKYLLNKKIYIKKFSSLIWPFYTFTILTLILNIILHNTGELSSFVYFKQVLLDMMFANDSIDTPLWFLTALFTTEIIFFQLLKYYKDKVIFIIFIIFVIGLLNAYSLDLKLFFNIHIAMIGLIFFTAGWYIKDKLYLMDIIKVNFFYKFIFLLMVLVFLALNNQKIDMYSMQYGNIFYFMGTSFIGIFLVLLISIRLDNIKFISIVLNYLGRNSLILLAMHGIIPLIVHYFIGTLPFRMDRIINIVLLFASIEFINRYFLIMLALKLNWRYKKSE